MALNNRVMVLTGGPGTGKTTVLKGILDPDREQNTTDNGKKIGSHGGKGKEKTFFKFRSAHTVENYVN